MTKEPDDEQTTIDSLATVFSGGALVSAAKVVSLGFGFLTQLVMARLLTETAYGQVVLTLAVVSIAGLVAKLGLDDGISRELPHHEDDPAAARGVIRAGLVIVSFSGLVVGIGVFLAAPTLANQIFKKPSLAPLIRIAAVGIPFMALSQIAISLARGARDARVQAYVGQLFNPATRLVFIGLLLIAGFSAVGAVVGQIASIVLGGLLALWLASRTLPSFEVPPKPMYRSILAFSLPLIVMQGMGFLNTNIDVYMTGYFLSPSMVGIYNIALQLDNVLTSVLGTVGFLLPPVLTHLQKQGKKVAITQTYQVLTKWMVVLVLPLFTILFFAPRFVIRTLFGPDYTSGALALRILLIGDLFAIMMGLTGQTLIALGENRIVSYIVVWQTILNIAINYFLVPNLGIEGAAIGMAISSVVGSILGVRILYQKFGIHPFTREIFAPPIVVTISTFLVYLIMPVQPVPIVGLITTMSVGYFTIIVKLVPEYEDKRLLQRLDEQTDYDFDLIWRVVTILCK